VPVGTPATTSLSRGGQHHPAACGFRHRSRPGARNRLQALLNVSDGGLAIAAAARLEALNDEIVMDVLAYVAWPGFGA
jgi:hypothetical protein